MADLAEVEAALLKLYGSQWQDILQLLISKRDSAAKASML
jgi:hypothetical protein